MPLLDDDAGKLKIDSSYDIPWVAGYSKDGKTVYIDRDVPRYLDLEDGRRADVHYFLAIHEFVEKSLMDTFGYSYQEAHEIALKAEQRAVEMEGIRWQEYDDLMQPFIVSSPNKEYKRVPSDLDLQPEYDSGDTEMLKKLQKALSKLVVETSSK